ncbi:MULTISPECIES: glycosyltransferase [unclassified Rhizobium]|uniref:glycosyltransferase n=1 Tax=unclassified Rhizobium TaxID=2613769 RepID=UPI0006F3C55A|nr:MULTISPECIES: glycosyltransferase [unclassified Rhizobium]KQV42550.1 hypothetical protein ASC86_19660 [Rhizobium sp. Root1212]KRD21420.1 hypothetical protein ASE37_17935 [Rhizobium sp. Root268]
MKTPTLAVIIAVRANDNVDILERLRWKNIPIDDHVQVVLVDDGSANARELEVLCEEKGWIYKHLMTNDAPFSLARSRNAGIKTATANYVYFEDADFLHKSNFYERLLHVADNLEESPFNFAAIPTLFLTEQASKALIEKVHSPADFDHQIDQFIAKLPFINPDVPNDLCDSFAPVGSNILVRRDLCFHVGLFDEYFNSWGGEDRDLIFRLLEKNSFLYRPHAFAETKKWAIHRTTVFEGWRSVYRLHGDWMAGMGIYAVHVHHPENGWKDPYERHANFSYAEKKAKEIVAGKLKVMPCEIPGAPLNIFIGRNPVFYNDEVMKAIGSVAIIDPDMKVPPEEFAQRVIERVPDRVFFQNPYGNDWLLELWNCLRSQGIKCVCAERGGLPWSIYLDEGGFCCGSDSYARHLWQGSAPIDAREYLAALRANGETLEPQKNTPIEKLTPLLTVGQRTVLVLLQSLTDATTRHFCAPLQNYDEFLSIIRDLDGIGRYNVLVKNHPLNKENPIEGVGVSVESYNIYDLYEVADVVVTLNSGGGMMALAAGRPVVTMGTTFYAQEDLAMSASDLDTLVDRIDNPTYDKGSVDRFYGYLLNDFYSFASWKYSQRDYSDKTRMSLMQEVRYSKIVLNGKATEVKRTLFDCFSLIMDPYAHHLYKNGHAASAFKPMPVKKASLLQSAMVPLIRPAVRLIGNRSDDIARFNADPAGYFAMLKNPGYRFVGRVLLGRP